MDEEFDADVGAGRGDGCCYDLDGEFDEWAEVFSVVYEACDVQQERCAGDYQQFAGFCEEAFGVLGDFGAEKVEQAGGKEQAGCDRSAEKEGCDGPEDRDASAEGGCGFVEAVFGWVRDEGGFYGPGADDGGEDRRDHKCPCQQAYR